MSKPLGRQNDALDAEQLDYLRELAGYSSRSVLMSKHRTNSRIVIIQRDAKGRVIGSTERIEESEYTDLQGQYFD